MPPTRSQPAGYLGEQRGPAGSPRDHRVDHLDGQQDSSGPLLDAALGPPAESYLSNREQRCTIIADVVVLTAERLERPDPLVFDIGCGPGSLSGGSVPIISWWAFASLCDATVTAAAAMPN